MFRRVYILLLVVWLSCPVFGQTTPESESAIDLKPAAVSFPKFTLGGHIQLQLDQGSLKSSGGRAPVRNGIGAQPVDSKLYFRRLRLYPKIKFSENLSLINETDFEAEDLSPDSMTLTLLDLYLKYEFTKGHHLRIGQAKLPFGYEFLNTSRKLTTVERSDVSRQFYQRDIGVGVYGKFGESDYGFGIYQGQGENNPESNKNFDFVGRYAHSFSPQWKLGISGHLGSIRLDSSLDDLTTRRAGLELHYDNGPWKLETEYILGDGFNLFSQKETDSRGFYVYGIRRLKPNLDFVLGYDRFDPDLGFADSLKSNSASNERDRMTVGLNYYLSREPVHRVMLNYEFRNELEGPSVNSQGFRLRYQYSW